MSLRQPPKPEGFRADWRAHGVLATSASQRKAVYARDKGTCHLCGLLALDWHAEHTVPLWVIDRANYPACLRYWAIGNLTTICLPCHQAKTSLEAGQRAKVKRIIAKRMPVTTRRNRPVPSRPRDWKAEYQRAKAWRAARDHRP